ncbi:hypothetical protein ACIQAA_29470 [Neobacillus sp. NPDC093182]
MIKLVLWAFFLLPWLSLFIMTIISITLYIYQMWQEGIIGGENKI